MITIGIWFCYDADELPLIESVAHFRKVNQGVGVCLAVDSARPISSTVLESINPDFVEWTTFNRSKGLYGWDAVDGVLRSIILACSETGATSAVKIDCDTLVDLSPWHDPALPYVGAETGLIPLGRGMACGIRKDAAESILAALTSPDRWRYNGYAAPEDSVICAESLRLFKDTKIHIRSSHHEALMVGYDWKDLATGFDRYKKSSVVTFGNRCFIPAPKSDHGQVIAERMRQLSESLRGSGSGQVEEDAIESVHFLSVPKNASQSMKELRIRGLMVHPHSTDGKGIMGEIIAFSRDPFERFASAFFWIKRLYSGNPAIHQIDNPSMFAELVAAGDLRAMAFFVGNAAKQTVGGKFIGCDFAFCPQSLWLDNASTIIPLSRAGEYVQDRFGVEMKYRNHSDHGQKWEWSATAIEWIRSFYKSDFTVTASTSTLQQFLISTH